MDGSNLVTVDTTVRLLTLADTPEFKELMAAIDDVTSGWYFPGMVERLVAAKKKFRERVVK